MGKKREKIDVSGQTDPDYCEQPEFHDMHFCKLARKGLVGEIAVRSKDPAFKCKKCNAEANQKRDLCKPRPIES